MENNASIILNKPQKIIGLLLLTVVVLFLFLYQYKALEIYNTIIHVFYFLTVSLKIVLIYYSIKRPKSIDTKNTTDWPTYCVMMPCYKEGKVIKQLVQNINNLDYPKDKLQVLVVVEDDDYETLDAIKQVVIPKHFQIFLVPTPLNPKGKPNACNHALKAVKTEYLVIYDAEDRPEPDQLKKAVMKFRSLPDNVVCLQGKLNYFNKDENWLTRMFTIEYSTWFDFFIYGLSKLNLPIPLGGTTNHIKVAPLKALGGWDKFNVTEDCDMGLRLVGLGYKVDYLESTTFEEACMKVGAWIKQRTRWTKGYMITWLVHMRHPIQFWRKAGTKGMLSVQLFILGTPLVNLLNPIMYGLFISWLLFDPPFIQELFNPLSLKLGFLLLTIGNICMILSSMIAVYKRGYYLLIPWCLLLPLYWLLQAVATYRALWQLITDPYVWEKTEHGVTKVN